MENIDNQQLELEQPLFKDIQIDKKVKIISIFY